MPIHNHRQTLNQQIHRYGLRKLKIGVTSVLLSTAVYMGATQMTAMASTADPQTNGNQEQAQVVASSTTNDVARTSQSTDSTDQSSVPTSTTNVNSVLTNQNVSNVEVEAKTGNTDEQGNATYGSTVLSFDFNLSAEQAQGLKAGDYVDIQMGMPYTVTATGQTERLSYGRIVNQTTPVEVWSQQGHLIGYIVTVNADNSYSGTQNQTGEGTTTPEWTSVQKKNVDAVKELGGTNGYYRLVFVDDINKYGAVSTKITALNLYNAFDNEDGGKAPTETPSFTLYSSDTSINSYQPQNDIQIGNATATSGLTIKVVHNDQATTLNTDDELGANTSTRTAAHWWYQRGAKGSNGEWVLGYNSLNDPVQSEGVSLTHEVGNEFNLVVTKPADTDKVTYYFADDEQVQKDLVNTIVGSSQTYATDPLNDNQKLSVGRETVITKPKVTVTSTQNGNTKTYHVKIDGEYSGFRHDTNGTHSYASTVTLLSWQPKDPTDLLPPADSGITDYQSDDPNGITKKYPGLPYVGGVLVDEELLRDLSAHPWQLKVVSQDGEEVHLSNVGSNGEAGYFFMKNPQLIYNAPSNYGIAVGSRPHFEKAVTKQIIHYWYDKIGGNTAAADTVREVVFNSSDNGTTWYNGTSPEDDHFQEGQFYDVDVPVISGYSSYAQDGSTPITKAGYQSYYTYGNPSLTTDYTQQPAYDAQTNALVVNVIYRAQQQHLLYQVVLEDDQGQIVQTVVPATELATGNSDAAIDNDTQQKWSALLKEYQTYTDPTTNRSYQLVSADRQTTLRTTDPLPTQFDHDSSVDQLVTIYLSPVPVVTPQPIKSTDTKTVLETIHYVYANGPHRGETASHDYTQQVQFQRSGSQDQVTGEQTWDSWLPGQSIMVAVPSPQIDGYHADQLVVPEQTVNSDSANIELTVYYSMDPQEQPSDNPQTPTPNTPVNEEPSHSNQTTANHGQSDGVSTPHQDQPTVATAHSKTTAITHREAELPQTGQSSTGLIGLGLLAMASSLGLLINRKKNN